MSPVEPTRRPALSTAPKLFGLALLALLCAACGSRYTVITESGPPSALKGATQAVVSFDYAKLVVEGRSETEWVARKTAEEADYEKTWADLKARFETHYMQGFTRGWPAASRLAEGEQPAEGAVRVVVDVRQLDMGRLVPFATTQSVITTRVKWNRKAEPDDEIQIQGADTPSLTNPSIFQHVGHIGAYLGGISARFLADKQE